MIKTINPPLINQKFNKDILLDFLQRSQLLIKDILLLSNKKIRAQDTGKKKQLNKLLEEYKEIYGRKKIEEENFKSKIKEKVKKRSYLPSQGGIIKFNKMDTRERSDECIYL